jgi:prepilin-type N-terminal cleavage/methylation domain-containing protein/prepilin-type processing-associated H-X9-DG protein
MTRPRPAGRPIGSAGFTLIELLVVMAIIGVLMALLLPAVQSARSAARRTQCLNNMMQVGLGLQNYESAWESFPPGVVNSTGPIANTAQGYHFSWIVQLLPFLEQNSTAGHLNFERGVYDASNLTVRQVRLKTMICPQDSGPSVIDGIAQSSYAGNYHHTEAPIDVTNSGVLFLNSAIRSEDIEDGASNTIAFGEKVIGGGDLGWASGTRATLRNGATSLRGGAAGVVATAAVPDPVGGFSSHHIGGANFAFADGHVQFLNQNTPVNLLQSYLNRHDGELIFSAQ